MSENLGVTSTNEVKATSEPEITIQEVVSATTEENTEQKAVNIKKAVVIKQEKWP